MKISVLRWEESLRWGEGWRGKSPQHLIVFLDGLYMEELWGLTRINVAQHGHRVGEQSEMMSRVSKI
jgi:hypothetical protein